MHRHKGKTPIHKGNVAKYKEKQGDIGANIRKT
jgi:hypothetical protein